MPVHGEKMGGDLPALFGAVTRVMGLVGYVHKGGQVRFGSTNYSYAGEGDIIRALRGAMQEHGLSMMPVGADVLSNERGMVTALCTYMLAHTGGGWLLVQAIGQGSDKGDKAAPKAMTGALKYALRQAFLLETGDDPDRDASGKTAQEIAEAERKQAEAERRKALGVDAKGHTQHWRDNHKRYCAQLGGAGLNYNDVAAWCESVNRPRPSAMEPAMVQKVWGLLLDERSDVRQKFNAWKQAQGEA